MRSLFGLSLADCNSFLHPCQQWVWLSELRQDTLSFQNHSQQWQSPVDAAEKQLWQRGIWSVAVLNVPWVVIVVIVASVASKQINLLTCCRKHQRKTMRKFYIILVVLCNFLPTSHLIFHQRTQHWKCPYGTRGRRYADLSSWISIVSWFFWKHWSGIFFPMYFMVASSDHLVRSGPY